MAGQKQPSVVLATERVNTTSAGRLNKAASCPAFVVPFKRTLCRRRISWCHNGPCSLAYLFNSTRTHVHLLADVGFQDIPFGGRFIFGLETATFYGRDSRSIISVLFKCLDIGDDLAPMETLMKSTSLSFISGRRNTATKAE